jgi:hypothetical protein
MVDRWEPYDVGGKRKLSRNASSKEMMEELREEAFRNTEAFADRRVILAAGSVEAASLLRDHVFDFVYIDADHFYESVRNDLSVWHPKVKTDGLLCGHDYNGGWDRKGVWGVKRAVDEFAEQNGYRVEVGSRRSYIWWLV